MLHQIVSWIVATIGRWGYPGIIVLMFLESSFFPSPSEVVVPPAGLAWMNLLPFAAFTTLGACYSFDPAKMRSPLIAIRLIFSPRVFNFVGTLVGSPTIVSSSSSIMTATLRAAEETGSPPV